MNRHARSAQELERIRRLAVKRVKQGRLQKDVAEFLEVDPRTVRRWVKADRDRGAAGLAAKPHPGAKPKLNVDQERQVLSWLERSPVEFGFPTELWTAPRVTRLIRERLKVQFNHRSINAWLTKRGITPQKPQRVPRERDQAKIDQWLKRDWPRIKKGASASRAYCVD